jgi:thioesterase domain-containing protein
LPPPTFEEMVIGYTAQIQRVSARGPYHLLGWSFGGLLAYAVATRLQKIGQTVGTLAILDSYPANSEQPLPKGPIKWNDILGNLFGFSGSDVGSHERAGAISETLQILRRVGNSSFDRSRLVAITTTFEQNVRSTTGLAPQRFEGDILFFKAMRRKDTFTPKAWSSYITGNVRVHEIDCDHDEMTAALPLALVGRIVAGNLR